MAGVSGCGAKAVEECPHAFPVLADESMANGDRRIFHELSILLECPLVRVENDGDLSRNHFADDPHDG